MTKFKAYKTHLSKLMLFLQNLFHLIKYIAFDYFILNFKDLFELEEGHDVVIFSVTLFPHQNFGQILIYFHFFSSFKIYSIVLILYLNQFMVILILILFFSFFLLHLISYQITFFINCIFVSFLFNKLIFYNI